MGKHGPSRTSPSTDAGIFGRVSTRARGAFVRRLARWASGDYSVGCTVLAALAFSAATNFSRMSSKGGKAGAISDACGIAWL